ncbi:hypothetical protein LOC67_08425 [Stieleria sp. JC731]|uniref:hypothetical protein n=1 Tax=Pirellulaceae TaxID=2691357 RepID=UPI001E63E9BA|nr:hypothetical protein [Stieleria sp. JC731]MCC9600584.1 hypothetical protein [Stieleria sp. JC731]
MAKCDLSIELDEPDRVYRAGEKVTGSVSVETDDSVKCKGLDVSSGWRTHGRGNVARQSVEKVTLFQGQWQAGHRETYRFELPVADWPPTYYGNYVNVEHFIDATVKIPWAFDPKASVDYVVRQRDAPMALKDGSKDAPGCFSNAVVVVLICSIIAVFIGVALTILAIPKVGGIIGLILVPIALLVAWRTLLPMWLLGKVKTEVVSKNVTPGEKVLVKMSFQPRRDVDVTKITAVLNGSEVCISGSGSNRTTHRHQFYEETHQLLSEAHLKAGDEQSFEFGIPIPSDAPYSFNLSDNDLRWSIDLRFDIPRWPDWKRSLDINVFPSSDAAEQPADDSHTLSESFTVGEETDETQNEAVEQDEITFVETADHLWKLRNDPDQVDVLVEAVLGLTFDMDVLVERRLLYSGTEDPHVYKDGYAVWARHDDPPLPLVLYVPHDLADDFEQTGRNSVPIRGTIVGWDHDHKRLQVKVLVR